MFPIVSSNYSNLLLQVYTDFDNARTWKECFSVGGVRLPLGFHLGASAATGDLTGEKNRLCDWQQTKQTNLLLVYHLDNHDIIAIKTYEIDVARSEKRDEVDRVHVIPYAQNVAAPRGKKMGFIFNLIVFRIFVNRPR